jgi:hypothetical protein
MYYYVVCMASALIVVYCCTVVFSMIHSFIHLTDLEQAIWESPYSSCHAIMSDMEYDGWIIRFKHVM